MTVLRREWRERGEKLGTLRAVLPRHTQLFAPGRPPPLPVSYTHLDVYKRQVPVPHLQSTLALWYLRSNSELMQDGDTGGTSASEQSSNRYGIEWANYYTPVEHLAVDFDLADSRALFTEIDPGDAAYTSVGGHLVQGPGGKLVPEAVKVVISSGVTLHDYKGFTSSLRLRYFGPRYLTSDGLYLSSQTVLLNGEIGYQFLKKWHVTAEFLNMLNRKDADIDYAYVYQISPTTAPAFGRVNHPTEPFLFRFALEKMCIRDRQNSCHVPG